MISPPTGSWPAIELEPVTTDLLASGIDPAHGVLRLSLLHYTSPAEIDQLIEALDRVL